MLKSLILGLLLGCLLWGCDQDTRPKHKSKSALPSTTAQNEEVINIKMTKYATQLVFQNADFQQKTLSENHKQELKNWWDSLPKPLQSEIKSKQVDIQVISNVQDNPQQPISSNLTDAKIEQTGAALENVIGAPTEMTYTVNTTTINGKSTPEVATTDILIVETVAVKLKEFALQIPTNHQNSISTEIAQTLQNWWISLPEEVQEQVKTQALWIDLQLIAADNNGIQLDTEQKLFAVEDILHRLIGFYKVGRRSQPLAKIQTSIVVESKKPYSFANQQISLQLRLNKVLSNTPTAS